MEFRANLVDMVSIIAFNADVKYGGVAAFSTSDQRFSRRGSAVSLLSPVWSMIR
jgi:hypothetical protein